MVPPDLLMTVTPQAFVALLGIDAGDRQHLEQFVERVVVDVVAFKIKTRRAGAVLGRQGIVQRTLERVEQRLRAEIRPADSEDDEMIDLIAHAAGQLNHLAQDARFRLTAMSVEQLLWQIDEAGVKWLHIGRHLLEIAFRGDLAANLQDARDQFAQLGLR